MQIILPAFALSILLLSACNNSDNKREADQPQVINSAQSKETPEVSIQQTDSVFAASPFHVGYKLVPFDSIDMSDGWKLEVICMLNRKDGGHFRKNDLIIIPDTFVNDQLYYSPFPLEVEMLKEVPKCILFSYAIQAFAAYEMGKLERWGAVSMGKSNTPTPCGLFHCNWKSLKTISTINGEWVMEWYINLDNQLGVSMHLYDLPGYPASHACIRLQLKDAQFFYYWTDSWKLKNNRTIERYGTPVVIFGYYNYQRDKPWFNADSTNKMQQVLTSEVNAELKKYLPLILERQSLQDTLLHQKEIN